MMGLRGRIFVGRHVKWQAFLFCIVVVCLVTFFYGLATYTDAPYKPCAGGDYCGKFGVHHSFEEYTQWKRWEALLIVFWPFGMMASFGINRLRKAPTSS